MIVFIPLEYYIIVWLQHVQHTLRLNTFAFAPQRNSAEPLKKWSIVALQKIQWRVQVHTHMPTHTQTYATPNPVNQPIGVTRPDDYPHNLETVQSEYTYKAFIYMYYIFYNFMCVHIISLNSSSIEKQS